MDRRVAELIERYDLEPLPVEGTLFAGTYRSAAETADVWLGPDDGQRVQFVIPAGTWQAVPDGFAT